MSNNNLSLDEIAYAFKNCTGETNHTLKEHITNNLFLKNEKDTYILDSLNNFILNDICILLKKSIINILSGDNLLRIGSSSWGFVTIYYSNFFAIQALNRLSLNFNLHLNNYFDVKIINYVDNKFLLTKVTASSGSHQSQFTKYFQNFKPYQTKKSINRSWTIGIRSLKDNSETILRNNINYSIDKQYYDELDINLDNFNKNIREFHKKPTESILNKPYKYSHSNLELALSRIEMIFYILNYLANKNSEYKSYFIKLNTQINKNLNDKFSGCSEYLMKKLYEANSFTELDITNDSVVL